MQTGVMAQGNVNISGQPFGDGQEKVALPTPVNAAVLKRTLDQDEQRSAFDQQKRVRFQIDQQESYLRSTSHDAQSNVGLNIVQQQSHQNVPPQYPKTVATQQGSFAQLESVPQTNTDFANAQFQQQMQNIANPVQILSDPVIAQHVQSVRNQQQACVSQVEQQVHSVSNPQQTLSASHMQPNIAAASTAATVQFPADIQHPSQPMIKPAEISVSAAMQQQSQPVENLSDNVLVSEIQEYIQIRIKEHVQPGIVVDHSALAVEVQQKMPLGINLDPTILFAEIQKQTRICAEQIKNVSSVNIDQQVRSAESNVSSVQLAQAATCAQSSQNVATPQQSQEYCRMVAFRSDGSRREFIIREQDGNQVLSLCAQADVSDPRNYSGVNTSMMYPAQTVQNFPQHWTLSDLHTDTSSSLATRSVQSAASGGLPCESIPSDKAR